MSKWILVVVMLTSFCIPAQGTELTAPTVPDSGKYLMPETESFSQGLMEMLEKALSGIHPDLNQALRVMASLVAAAVIVGIVSCVSSRSSEIAELSGAVYICASMFFSMNTMIRLGTQTVTDISEYGKLLFPVLAAALAAQGGVTASGALYAGTAAFNTLLSGMISGLLIPMVYLFLGFGAALAMTGEGALKQMRDLIKTFLSWCLKTILTVFTTYMAITGVVSGTTDAAALKAAKVTISSFVPVVGGILSDASEAVLVSASLAKNAAGIYGILAVAAVFLSPFLKIGIQYLMLKCTAGLCSIFGPKRMTELMGDFSTAMGLLLSMTGAACLLQLISTVCFLRGTGL